MGIVFDFSTLVDIDGEFSVMNSLIGLPRSTALCTILVMLNARIGITFEAVRLSRSVAQLIRPDCYYIGKILDAGYIKLLLIITFIKIVTPYASAVILLLD